MRALSILIPTYNDVCLTLVTDLHRQAEQAGCDFEIIVADDGSTDTAVIQANRPINRLSHCRYIERRENVGRAAIRNFLVHEAQYDWLLFIDGDMMVRHDDFLQRYISSPTDGIIYGGVTVSQWQSDNLRSLYEHHAAPQHTVTQRQREPYFDFHTANFMASRQLMLQHPFDIRFRHYGYEDVFFGKQMQQLHISIIHIDSPLSFERFETNEQFLKKTEEGLRTLYLFREELKGYSRLLELFHAPFSPILVPLLAVWHRLFSSLEHSNLTGSHPSLLLFSLYKLGYFARLHYSSTT